MKELVHVLPVDDLKEHIESDDCWCGPMIKNVEADRTAAIRKLRECVMTANAAIACNE